MTKTPTETGNLPFARVVRCDDCAFHETVETVARHEALLNGRCPDCGSVMLASRPVAVDARYLRATA